MNADKVKEILKKLNFEKRFTTDQTAVCILIMLDKTKRADLLFDTLNDGVRIHDIIKYAEILLNKKYAENTRESIRKSSLKRLVDHGVVIVNRDNPSRPTNSGNTNYVLEKSFENILKADNSSKGGLIESWLKSHESLLKIKKELDMKNKVRVTIHSRIVELSPGKHNVLIKEIIESFCKLYVKKPAVVYVGDTRNKEVYTNKSMLEQLEFNIDVHDKLPDVIVYDKADKTIIVVESVTSVGPFEELRKKEVDKLINKRIKNKKMIKSVFYITAFLDRDTFRRFSKIIAWDTAVWIAREPEGLIKYEINH